MLTYFYENNYLSYCFYHYNSFKKEQNDDSINNINLFSELNENKIQENHNPDLLSFFINSYSDFSISKLNTNWETKQKRKNLAPINEINQEDESNYKYSSFHEIKKNFNKNIFTEDNFIENKNIEDSEYKLKIKSKNIEDDEYKLNNKKRRRENESIVISKKEKEEAGDNITRGPKLNPDNKKQYKIENNKNSKDNIFKTIKANLLIYPLFFINHILQSFNIKKRLFELDYNYINQLKKKEDINIIKKTLKELYSLDINNKLTNLRKDYNKTIIEEIIQNKRIKDYETIMFVFNLSFEDWIELFCYKKNINELLKKYEEIHKINEEAIKNSLIYVEGLKRRKLAKNDKHNFSILLKQWFYVKNGFNEDK